MQVRKKAVLEDRGQTLAITLHAHTHSSKRVVGSAQAINDYQVPFAGYILPVFLFADQVLGPRQHTAKYTAKVKQRPKTLLQHCLINFVFQNPQLKSCMFRFSLLFCT